MDKPNVAFVHDYLNQYGGAEKTLERMTDIFPEAPIYTGIYNPARVPSAFRYKKVFSPTNFATKNFSKYVTFVMPLIFENFNLDGYDIIISSGTAWAKGVLTKPAQLHISLIHTPPRFLYKYPGESSKRDRWYFKPVIPYLDHYLRVWDYVAAQRPDFIVANSENAQRRISKFYKRDSTVIYPPVENIPATHQKALVEGRYYAAVGRLSAYKNFDRLVQAFNMTGLQLVIVGTGLEENKLKKMAAANVKFMGFVSEEKKHSLIENSLGLVNPVIEEDFGIVPVEAMYHGKPVLAHKSGGHLETIKEGVNGMFFEDLSVETLISKLKEFDQAIRSDKFDSDKIKAGASRFAVETFKNNFRQFVLDRWRDFSDAGTS